MSRALITGIGGQDGSYLAELLLERGLRGLGVVRRAERGRIANLDGVRDRVELLEADLLDRRRCVRALEHRAAARGLQPRLALVRADVVGAAGPDRGVRGRSARPRCSRRSARSIPRSASTRRRRARSSASRASARRPSETPLEPVTPYGVAKAYAHFIVSTYRERYGLLACVRDPLQPRVAAAAARVPAAQGCPRRRRDLARPAARARARRPRRAARLGLRGGLRPRDVADAAAGRAGRLRHRVRREPFGQGARRRAPSRTSGSTGRTTFASTSAAARRGGAPRPRW